MRKLRSSTQYLLYSTMSLRTSDAQVVSVFT